jgi:hypothetical protein
MTGIARLFATNTRATAFARFSTLTGAGERFFAGADRTGRRIDGILVDRVEADERDGVGAVDSATLTATAVAALATGCSRAPIATAGVGGVFLRLDPSVFAGRESEAESTAAAFAPFSAFATRSGFAPLSGIAFEDRAFNAQRASSVVDRTAETVRSTTAAAPGSPMPPAVPPPPSLPKPPSPPLAPEPPVPPLPP